MRSSFSFTLKAEKIELTISESTERHPSALLAAVFGAPADDPSAIHEENHVMASPPPAGKGKPPPKAPPPSTPKAPPKQTPKK